MSSVHRNPTEESFIIWLSHFPESFHPLDMQRFYNFAHNVNSYCSKRWLDKSYFEEQIRLHQPNFKQENVELFYERLLICRDYFESFKTPLVYGDGTQWCEVKVVNHKIVSEPIDDINSYFFKFPKRKIKQ